MCEGDEEDGGGETEKINLEHHRGLNLSVDLYGENRRDSWVAEKKDDLPYVDMRVFIY